jgi:hypothetical protein
LGVSTVAAEPGTIDPRAVAQHHDDDMKTRTKIRIAEILLLSFIVAFIHRAIPNVDIIPDLPASENQIDDREWGNITRMKFMETHPSAGTPTLKPVRPEKFWLQRPRIYLA